MARLGISAKELKRLQARGAKVLGVTEAPKKERAAPVRWPRCPHGELATWSGLVDTVDGWRNYAACDLPECRAAVPLPALTKEEP